MNKLGSTLICLDPFGLNWFHWNPFWFIWILWISLASYYITERFLLAVLVSKNSELGNLRMNCLLRIARPRFFTKVKMYLTEIDLPGKNSISNPWEWHHWIKIRGTNLFKQDWLPTYAASFFFFSLLSAVYCLVSRV